MVSVTLLAVIACSGALVCAAPHSTRRDTNTSKVLSSVVASATIASSTPASTVLPTVDLTYAIHQATINDTGGYYNFSNIRYAAPPTGNLRFAAPIPPFTVNRTVNDGQQGAICAQALPYWEQVTEYELEGADAATLAYVESEVAYVESALTIASVAATGGDPRTSEDCLFLDVIVLEKIFTAKKAAPVLVWVYGGGYVFGDKTMDGNPASLISRSLENDGEGLIFVAMNYRLGLFGWLGSESFNGQGGLSNAALYDQRLAFEWVQKYIHLFGGDPDRVTVIGESAGAGSIQHQITAFGGALGAAPFNQAVLQSPGFSPVPGNAEQEATYSSVLSQAQTLISADITNLTALRSLDFGVLAALNAIAIARSAPYGTFTFGPVVDGLFVPELPGKLFLEGKFDKTVSVMTAHNSDEGLEFTSPFLTTEAAFIANIQEVFPTATNETIDYMTTTLYPAVYDGTYPYTTLFERASLFTAEVVFTCNARYTNLAYNNETYSYYFTVPPGLHGEDVPYTFFNGDTTTLDDGLPVNATVASTVQRYITNFALNGNPNGATVPFFPKYQSNSTVVVLGDDGLGALQVDTVANDRCTWWQTAAYA